MYICEYVIRYNGKKHAIGDEITFKKGDEKIKAELLELDRIVEVKEKK